MSVKSFIDMARSIDGYDGVAIFYDGSVLFIERMEENYAIGLYGLYAGIASIFKESPSSLTMESGHRIVEAIRGGCMIAFVRYTGHHVSDISFQDDDELVDTGALSALPSREAARTEAASILKRIGF